TLMLLFAIGKKLKDEKFAWLWVLAYAGSILPQFYFKSGIIDPWFNLFMFIGIYAFAEYAQNKFQLKWLFISGLAAGLAALTKGPVGIGIVGLTIGIYYIVNRFRNFPPILHIVYYVFFIGLSILPWVVIEVARNGTWFLSEFFKYQLRLATTEDASHGGFFGYHFVVVFFLCFPVSAFAIRPLFQKTDASTHYLDFKKWMIITFWVVMIVFSIVQTKIAHYSSMAYFPFTFLGAYGLYATVDKWKKWEVAILIFTGTVFISLALLIPYVLQHPSLITEFVTDEFSNQALYAESNWNGLEIIPPIMVLIALIVALYFNSRNMVQKAVWVLFISAAVAINLSTVLFVPNIERYSQGAMIDFLKEKTQEDCYKEVIGYKSYAHLFYGQRKPTDNINPTFLTWLKTTHPEEEYTAARYRSLFSFWLVYGNIDKPAYFVTTVRKKDGFDQMQGMELIGEKNGYVFFKRLPTK
ncbi:MAG: glycosyltransferase family 39 protein, partial [Chitinophagales bacterium]|nr:glycosyltransferase family 39 protein [Chitinophagales bacterium]